MDNRLNVTQTNKSISPTNTTIPDTMMAMDVEAWKKNFFVSDKNTNAFTNSINTIKAETQEKQVSDGGSSSYYKLPPDAIELQDLIEYCEMNFSIGNIFKACFRKNRKSDVDELYDINKIIWFAQREKARIEKALKNES